MEIKSHLTQLLSTKMDRREFIKNVALGAVALIGGGVLLRLSSSSKGHGSEAPTGAYGDVAYGGGRPRTGGKTT
jgi:hypothetical protein